MRKASQAYSRIKQIGKGRHKARGGPSVTRSIANAVCVKKGNIFFVADSDGSVPLHDGHGFGLYYHDCRYLNGYELQVAAASPIVLAAARGSLGSATFELTNPHLAFPTGQQLPSGSIGISWTRELDSEGLRLLDRIYFKDYALSRVQFPITLAFGSVFDDLFTVRGLITERPGKLHAVKWQDGKLVFSYEGADNYHRKLTVSFSPQPDTVGASSAGYDIKLDRLEGREIRIELAISETRAREASASNAPVRISKKLPDPKDALTDGAAQWSKAWPAIQCDNLLLNQVIERANRDLESLWTSLRGLGFFAAGIPWFTTLFGRDSAVTAMEMLPFTPDVAAETLRLLASYQADKVDPWRDAQPGKILHELRVGELAATGRIPHSPYYGSVDATPLFIILLDEYVRWTGNLGLFDELREPAERALQWIDQYSDSDGDGYTDYKTASKQGLANQGWKDSLDAVLNADGSYATPPIALAEVQGYVYRARLGMARFYDRKGEAAKAAAQRQAADALRSRFNRDFWSDELGIYVLALQAKGKPVSVVASNAGQTLWSGIAEPEPARRTVQRLMAKDMFAGWGVRTLSQAEKGYNPIGYHVGSIWPHDNALIASGFRQYGYHNEAMELFNGLINSAMNFEEFQIPELYSGFSRERYSIPVHFPAACHPQAWAAGSIPFLLCDMLGLEPNAPDHRLEIRHPILPDAVNSLDLCGVHIGQYSVNIEYGRDSDDRTIVHSVKSDPGLQVVIH
ncbi:MAG TPA: glycogen debranching N-terminal domain-containing protein [Anaerolineales bacterium]|nr:glycogen debranching N-terminal domain-containing protein [Anaerolineales bacterium]